MSKSEQKVVPPHFSLMSDEELLAWYAELQARAINPPPGDVDFPHTHQAAAPMTAAEVRAQIMAFQGWSEDLTTQDAGSPFHNLWHWLSD